MKSNSNTKEHAPFKNPWDKGLKKHHMEKGGGLSKTVPDETLSVKEILERFTRGVPMITKPGHYPDMDADFDDLDLEAFDRLEIPLKVEIAKEFNKYVEIAKNVKIPSKSKVDKEEGETPKSA